MHSKQNDVEKEGNRTMWRRKEFSLSDCMCTATVCTSNDSTCTLTSVASVQGSSSPETAHLSSEPTACCEVVEGEPVVQSLCGYVRW